MLIAGVSMSITWHGLAPRAVVYRGYEEFLSSASCQSADIQIDIHPLSDAPFRPSPAGKLFDSEQSWVLYREKSAYWLSLSPPFHSQAPFWLARFDASVTRVEVFLNTANGLNHPDDPVKYPLDQLLLVHHLATRSGLLLHAAGADFAGRGLVFPGRSRAGKSTLSRLLQSEPGVELLSDDRIVVRKIDGGFRAFGTPWPGEAGIAKNCSAPLNSVLFLNQAIDSRIEEIAPEKALEKLLPISSIPWYDKELLPDVLNTCEELLNQVPSYDLHFRPDSCVVELLNDLPCVRRIS